MADRVAQVHDRLIHVSNSYGGWHAHVSAEWADEAGEDYARQGRKIDVLVVSLWASRGHELDAVEIKVSRSDWKRELDNAAKADWWWRHAHRFWIACPADLAAKIKDEIPDGWGLLAVSEAGCKVLVKPKKHTPEPFTWQTTIGLLRASADAGFGALQRAEQRGFDRACKQQADRAEAADPYTRSRLARCEAVLTAYRDATGIDLLAGTAYDAGQVGRIVHALKDGGLPHLERRMRNAEAALASVTRDLATAIEAVTIQGQAR